MTSREITFDSGGLRCAATLYLPDLRPDAPRPPVIVMAHGLGAVREMRLAAYAERFTAAGYAAQAGEETHQARRLYADGFLRQIWHRGDRPGACILVEARDEHEARERLRTLPLYAADMLEFQLIPLKPYAGFGPR